MKTKNLFSFLLMGCVYYVSAQYEGNVGINTTTPTATLNVKGKGMTVSTQALKIENSAGTNLLTINDNGTVSGSAVANLGSGGGTNGLNALVNTSPEAAGANCTAGGIRIVSGQDNNGNGTLDQAEITSTRYVCNGSNGTNGAGFANGTSGGQIYLTGASTPFSPQAPISMSGDVGINSTGATAIVTNAVSTTKINDLAVTTAKLANSSVTTAKISATGTASASTYLRGDGSWQAPTSSAGGFSNTTINASTTISTDNQIVTIIGTTTLTLPASPANGQIVYVISPTANGTINANGKQIILQDGSALSGFSYSSYGGVYRISILIYNGSAWYNGF